MVEHITHYKKVLPFPIGRHHVFSDGAPGHFKVCHTFNFMRAYRTNHGVPLSWTTSAAGHGKGPNDAAGAFLKREADRARTLEDYRECGIPDANAFYKWCAKHWSDNPSYDSAKRYSPRRRLFRFIPLGQIDRLNRHCAATAPGSSDWFDFHSCEDDPAVLLVRHFPCKCSHCIEGRFACCRFPLNNMQRVRIPVIKYTAQDMLHLDKGSLAVAIAEKQGPQQIMAVRTRDDDERPFFDLVRCEYWDESNTGKGLVQWVPGPDCISCPITGACFPPGEPVMKVTLISRVPGQTLLFYSETGNDTVIVSARCALKGKLTLCPQTFRGTQCLLLGAKTNQDIEQLRLSDDDYLTLISVQYSAQIINVPSQNRRKNWSVFL